MGSGGGRAEMRRARAEERWQAFMELEPRLCACCGCELSPYEVFAGRLRGLRRPVCLGCAYTAVVWLRDNLFPLCEKALELLEAAFIARDEEASSLEGCPDDHPLFDHWGESCG